MSPSSPRAGLAAGERFARWPVVTLLAMAAPAAGPDRASPRTPRAPRRRRRELNARVTDVARGLEHPWGLEFLPDGRMLVTERPGRLRLIGRDGQALGAADRCARGLRARPGRAARRGAEPRLRPGPPRLPVLRRAGRGRRGHRGGARAPRRERPRGHPGDLAPGAQGHGSESLGLAARVPARRHALRHPGRAIRSISTARRISPPRWARSCASMATAPSRATIPSSAATGARPEIWSYGHRNIRPPRWTRAASCGRWSMVRGVATSSIIPRRARTTAGPSSRTASTTPAPASAWARPSRAWSSPSSTGIR